MPVLRPNKLHHSPEEHLLFQQEETIPFPSAPAEKTDQAVEQKQAPEEPAITAAAAETGDEAPVVSPPVLPRLWERLRRLFRP